MLSNNSFPKLTSAFFIAAFSWLLLSPTPAWSQDISVQCKNQITSGGRGEVFVVPDTVSMSFGFSERSADLRSASSKMGKSLNDALRVLKRHGVRDADIQTSHVRIRPEYNFPSSDDRQGTPTVSYFLSQSLAVTLKNPDRYEEIFRALLDVGINEVQNVSFVVSNPVPHQEKALADAVKDAKRKAGIIADAAKVRLGDRIFINEAGTAHVSPRMGAVMGPVASMDGAGGGFAVGQVSIEANVVTTFASECR